MIVKDEVEFLGRCLGSVRGVIDYWVICDTGSTDGTQDLVRRELASVAGELYEHEWVDFGTNRTRALQLARGKADYLLVIDADATLEVEPGAFDALTVDAYALPHSDEVSCGYRTCLVRGALDWRYVGAVHEHIASDDDYSFELLEGVTVRVWSIGGARNRRYEDEVRVLERMHNEDSGNSRWVFFLAQTYRDLGKLDAAIEMYDRRVEMGGWDEEVFFAMLQAAVLRARRGEWPEAMAGLIAAWESRPSRMEPLYELASRLRLRGEHHTAYLFARRGLDQPVPRDLLCVSPWMYEWGMLLLSAAEFGRGRGSLRR